MINTPAADVKEKTIDKLRRLLSRKKADATTLRQTIQVNPRNNTDSLPSEHPIPLLRNFDPPSLLFHDQYDDSINSLEDSTMLPVLEGANLRRTIVNSTGEQAYDYQRPNPMSLGFDRIRRRIDHTNGPNTISLVDNFEQLSTHSKNAYQEDSSKRSSGYSFSNIYPIATKPVSKNSPMAEQSELIRPMQYDFDPGIISSGPINARNSRVSYGMIRVNAPQSFIAETHMSNSFVEANIPPALQLPINTDKYQSASVKQNDHVVGGMKRRLSRISESFPTSRRLSKEASHSMTEKPGLFKPMQQNKQYELEQSSEVVASTLEKSRLAEPLQQNEQHELRQNSKVVALSLTGVSDESPLHVVTRPLQAEYPNEHLTNERASTQDNILRRTSKMSYDTSEQNAMRNIGSLLQDPSSFTITKSKEQRQAVVKEAQEPLGARGEAHAVIGISESPRSHIDSRVAPQSDFQLGGFSKHPITSQNSLPLLSLPYHFQPGSKIQLGSEEAQMKTNSDNKQDSNIMRDLDQIEGLLRNVRLQVNHQPSYVASESKKHKKNISKSTIKVGDGFSPRLNNDFEQESSAGSTISSSSYSSDLSEQQHNRNNDDVCLILAESLQCIRNKKHRKSVKAALLGLTATNGERGRNVPKVKVVRQKVGKISNSHIDADRCYYVGKTPKHTARHSPYSRANKRYEQGVDEIHFDQLIPDSFNPYGRQSRDYNFSL